MAPCPSARTAPKLCTTGRDFRACITLLYLSRAHHDLVAAVAHAARRTGHVTAVRVDLVVWQVTHARAAGVVGGAEVGGLVGFVCIMVDRRRALQVSGERQLVDRQHR